jgi:hypothetical protein
VAGATGSVILASAEPKGADKVATTAKAKPIDPKADALLRAMGQALGDMKSFKFDSESVMEVVTKEGQKIQGLAESSVAIQRPDKLRVDRMGPLGGGSIYYDGKTFTFFGKRDNLYATAPAPDNLDATIDFAREKLSIDAPAADLIYKDPYAVLMEDAVSGKSLGAAMVGDRTCHHLAYRGTETDWQIWVEEGQKALPCRFVITSKKVTGQPEFMITMTNWKEQPLQADSFTFEPPEGATKIQFVTVSDTVTKTRQARRN